MKKLISILLVMILLMSAAAAETVIRPTEDRGITVNPAGTNTVPDGISPTTGRTLAELTAPDGYAGLAVTGRYMPALVQIDNTLGGTGYRAPRGLLYTDVIYESPLTTAGETRLTFLFSDLIPDDVGPTRSARVLHAWLREEWDCAFVRYGQQEYPPTNVYDVFFATGANKKEVLFNGTDGPAKPWKKFFYKDPILTSPHDKFANVAAMVTTIVPDDFSAADRAWLFTDELPTAGDEAEMIRVSWNVKSDYNSILEWDDEEQCYYRYMITYKYGKESGYEAYVDYNYRQDPVTFSNIIVQFTDFEYPGSDAPLPTVLGKGNADYFIGGRHIAGVWQRDDLSSRTVFYGPDGNEIELQRGRTLIVIMDHNISGRSISYE
ncbi:MAG: DUF3048 C-terminal domain-containing protein [Clostridia bacterium]|nr:DUF3048 C-terminal domain-containing protein [Clostridia bacterium]